MVNKLEATEKEKQTTRWIIQAGEYNGKTTIKIEQKIQNQRLFSRKKTKKSKNKGLPMTLDRFMQLVRLKHLECKSDEKVEFKLSIGELANIVSEIDALKTELMRANIANATLATSIKRLETKEVKRLDCLC